YGEGTATADQVRGRPWPELLCRGCLRGSAMPIGRYKVAILADIATVKSLRALIVLAALCAFAPCGFAAARVVPLPRPRPVEISPAPPAQETTLEEAPAPSACRLRLTAELAGAPPLPPPAGPARAAAAAPVA